MSISFLYIFCFCEISLANVPIIIERGSVEEVVLLSSLKTDIKLLLKNPESVENISNNFSIQSIYEINTALKNKLNLLHKLFPQTTENLLVDLLDNHSNNKVRQMAAYLMGKWYLEKVPNNNHPAVVTSLLNSMEDPYWLVRVEAAKALMNMKQGYDHLFYWLENERESKVRLAILTSLYNPTKATSTPSGWMSQFISTLIQLAKNDKDIVIRERAIGIMMYVVVNDKVSWNETEQEAALDCLIEIANNREEEQSLRESAVEQLSFIIKNDFINKSISVRTTSTF